MGNHYHLLIETPEGNLSQGMRQLNSEYSQTFNSVRNRVGHLLQGRFKSFVIEKETYLLEVARYIVLNPVRANFVSHPGDWPWSSYSAMIDEIKTPVFLTKDDILSYFGSRRSLAKKRYITFVQEGIGLVSPFDQVQHGSLLGSPQFIDTIWNLGETDHLKEISRKERIIGRPELKDIFANLTSKQERDDLIHFAKVNCGYSLIDIANMLGIHYSTVSKICSNSRFKI